MNNLDLMFTDGGIGSFDTLPDIASISGEIYFDSVFVLDFRCLEVIFV